MSIVYIPITHNFAPDKKKKIFTDDISLQNLHWVISDLHQALDIVVVFRT
jgi:hypothetical protein